MINTKGLKCFYQESIKAIVTSDLLTTVREIQWHFVSPVLTMRIKFSEQTHSFSFGTQSIGLYWHKIYIGCIGMNNRFSRREADFV